MNAPLFMKHRLIVLIGFCVVFVGAVSYAMISSRHRCVWKASAEALASDHRYISVLMDGDVRLTVDRHDEALCRKVNLTDPLMRTVQDVTRRLVKKDSHVVEIGAGYGAYTLRLARMVGDGGRVVSFEVNPRIAEHLQQALTHNQIHNVTLRVEGIADQEIDLVHVTGTTSSGHKQVRTKLVRERLREKFCKPGVSCSATTLHTLDTLMPDARIDFLSIDVADYAPLIVKGAAQILATNPNITVLLHWRPKQTPRHQQNVDELLAFFEYEKFNIWRIDPVRGLQATTLDALFESTPAYIVLSRKRAL